MVARNQLEDVKKEDEFIDLGSTGLKVSGGVIREEWLTELQGRQKWSIYREMQDNEALLSGALFAIRNLLKGVSWKVEAPKAEEEEDGPEQEAAEFLDSCMHDMSAPWNQNLEEILSFVPYGFSYHEIVYKHRVGPMETEPERKSKFTDGRIGWRKMPTRAQETITKWSIGKDGGIEGAWQWVPHNIQSQKVFLPIEKCLLFRNAPHKGNPEGKSLFRGSYTSFYFKKKLQMLEAIGIERELNGIPVIYAPARIMSSGAPANEKMMYTELKNIVRNIRMDEQAGIVMPGDRDDNSNLIYEFKLVSTQGRRAIDVGKSIQRHSVEMLIAFMADFLLLGHEKVGSFALSTDKIALFAAAINTIADEVAEVYNRHAIPRLLELNNMVNLKEYPKMVHGAVSTEDVSALTESVWKLAQAGYTMQDKSTQDEMRAKLGLPELSEEDFEDEMLGGGIGSGGVVPEPGEVEEEEEE